ESGRLKLVQMPLRDIFARDQSHRLVALPAHRLGVFADPENRPVLTRLSDFPTARLTGRVQTGSNFLPHHFPVFFNNKIERRLSDQFVDRIAKLRTNRGVGRQDNAGSIGHEAHRWMVLENVPPRPFTPAQGACGILKTLDVGWTAVHLPRNRTPLPRDQNSSPYR